MKRSQTIYVIFCTLITLFCHSALASWAAVNSDIAITHSKPVFDRINRVYVSTVSITNNGTNEVKGPLRLLIDNSSIEVNGEDGFSTQGVPYFSIAQANLAAGATIHVNASFDLQRKTLSFDGQLQHVDPDIAVYAQAEGGDASTLVHKGSQFNVVEGEPSYVAINSTDVNEPSNDDRVIELQVSFPVAASYELYARLRVGPAGGNDDSFFAPQGFGSGNVWTSINSISGFTAPGETGYTAGEFVLSGGSATTQVWKWSKIAVDPFVVEENDLIKTFRFAGREDGLDIDKFAFGQEGVLYTVEQLENGLAGERTLPPEPYVPEGPPMAQGLDKFLGGVCCGRQRVNFEAYFNQITPENAGKWASVESVRDVYNWTELDEAYQLAKTNGYVYKHHVLVWGSQQPTWISELPVEEQLEEILEWYNAVNGRYPAIDFIEVVNEFDNQPPDGGNGRPNYINALRSFDPSVTDDLIAQFLSEGDDLSRATSRAAEFDWIINSFQMARNIFPASTKLMINEYSVINTNTRTDKMLKLVGLLQDRGLIDAIGFQGHAFSTTGGNQNMLNNLDRLAATGFDLYVTELDIDGPNDLTQLLDYQRIFPLFWEHYAVKGITLWGYLPGHWRENQGAILAYENGAERPALVWLRSYVRGLAPEIINPGDIVIDEQTLVGSVVANLSATGPGGSAIAEGAQIRWHLLGGTAMAAFTLDPVTGALTMSAQPPGGQSNLFVQVQVDDYTSMVLDLGVNAPGNNEPVVITYDFESGLGGWRGDYGTPTAVTHNVAEQAAEITPDWTVNVQNVIGQIAQTDYTGATVEYTLRVTQAQVDAGMTAQGYVQTGAQSSYARMYGPAVPLVAGVNTFIFTPSDNGNNDIAIIERVSLQLNGSLLGTPAENDTVLLDKVVVTLP